MIDKTAVINIPVMSKADSAFDYYAALLEYLHGSVPTKDFVFRLADNYATRGQIYMMTSQQTNCLVATDGEFFLTLISPTKKAAYVEAISSDGHDRQANEDVADRMVDLQWTLLDVLGSNAHFIINTENLFVPRSSTLTDDLDRVRADDRLKDISVLWAPIMLQDVPEKSRFTTRDRLTLTAVKFIDIIYSLRKSGLSAVHTNNGETALFDVLKMLSKG